MERLAPPKTRDRASTPRRAPAGGSAPSSTHGTGPSMVDVFAGVVAAALVVATGAIHLHLYTDGYSAVPTIGPLFLANFVVAVVLGIALLARPRPLWALLGAGFCLATLAGFLISVHWGLFGYQETLRGAWQARAAVVEVAGAIACTLRAIRARGAGLA